MYSVCVCYICLLFTVSFYDYSVRHRRGGRCSYCKPCLRFVLQLGQEAHRAGGGCDLLGAEDDRDLNGI